VNGQDRANIRLSQRCEHAETLQYGLCFELLLSVSISWGAAERTCTCIFRGRDHGLYIALHTDAQQGPECCVITVQATTGDNYTSVKENRIEVLGYVFE
jgi:hypothetical protein